MVLENNTVHQHFQHIIIIFNMFSGDSAAVPDVQLRSKEARGRVKVNGRVPLMTQVVFGSL